MRHRVEKIVQAIVVFALLFRAQPLMAGAIGQLEAMTGQHINRFNYHGMPSGAGAGAVGGAASMSSAMGALGAASMLMSLFSMTGGSSGPSPEQLRAQENARWEMQQQEQERVRIEEQKFQQGKGNLLGQMKGVDGGPIGQTTPQPANQDDLLSKMRNSVSDIKISGTPPPPPPMQQPQPSQPRPEIKSPPMPSRTAFEEATTGETVFDKFNEMIDKYTEFHTDILESETADFIGLPKLKDALDVGRLMNKTAESSMSFLRESADALTRMDMPKMRRLTEENNKWLEQQKDEYESEARDAVASNVIDKVPVVGKVGNWFYSSFSAVP